MFTPKTNAQKRFQSDESELKHAFCIFDKNGDGYISRTELKQGLNNLGEEFSDDEIEYMIREADTDQDGEINYQEFVKVMTKNDKKQ